MVEYIDLGLPSGKKWMKCNLGASKPTEYGDYYAWGEITPRATDTFTEENFKGNETLTSGKLDPSEDAVHQLLGGNWYMPTKDDFQELCDTANCTNEWVTDYEGSGVNGRLFTSVRNGNGLFFPASGGCSGSGLVSAGSLGFCWSSTSYSSTSSAYALHFNSGLVICTLPYLRFCGLPVRGVCCE
ncbi:MAG: hypothetical protein NC548_44365 [Lachnospiraceae bacterium]|nr:hypothetical protein [Lachnospiraceae bacterium]